MVEELPLTPQYKRWARPSRSFASRAPRSVHVQRPLFNAHGVKHGSLDIAAVRALKNDRHIPPDLKIAAEPYSFTVFVKDLRAN